MQVLFFVILVTLIAKRVKTTKEEEKNFLANYGTLFEEFNFTGLSSCYFYLIFITRRYALIASILFFSTPLFKILVSFVFSIIVFVIQTSLYFLCVNPCKDKINQIYLILNEALTSVFYAYIAFQFLGIIENDEVSQGDKCIKMIQVALGLNCMFGLISGFYNVFQFFQNCDKRKVIPINKNLFWENNLTTKECSRPPNYFPKSTK